ncbi:MAG: hypothetical protein N2Z81_06885 [Hydrogenothermaceae bacterium]|nr:hypothetical protein [Hydrogenothermaceae bacterium]
MNLIKILAVGFVILILQSSVILRFLDINFLPDFIFIYLLLTFIYKDYTFIQFIFISLILGVSVDSITGIYPIFETVIFPLTATVVYLLKDKIFISNFFLKFIIFLFFSILSFIIKSILIYLYTEIFTFNIVDIYYITISNTVALYLFYYLREFLYGRVFEK